MSGWKDYFNLAFRTFLHQKKRTMLTLIGIFIGIAAVVSLISLGQGLQNSINKQFEVLGTNKIIIQAGTGGMMGATSLKLSADDAEAIGSISGVDEVGTAVYKLARVKYKDRTIYTSVIGIDTGSSKDMILESFGVNLEAGRGISGDSDVLSGYNLWSGETFDKEVGIGDAIYIEDTKFEVSGDVEKIGNPSDDSQVYISITGARDAFGLADDEVDFIVASIDKNEAPSDVAEKIKKKLRKIRDVEEGEEDFTVQTTEDIMKSFKTILLIVQIVLIGIAAISLLVGGVNITNTIYTSVLERTNEIGIMKAIGARNSDVFFIFLVESGILGLAGGIIGIALGIGMSKFVAFAAAQAGWSMIQTSFPSYLIFGALAFSFVVGAIAGVIPAYQASKMKPVDALRYE